MKVRLTCTRSKVLLAAVGLSTVSLSASAATATSNLSASATIAANCTISTAAASFGSYDPVSANASTALDGTGTVTVNCTSGSSATVTLGQGSNVATGSTDADPARRLKDAGTNHLTYSLFSDTGRTTEWGNTALTGVAHTGSGTATALTVYGSVAAGQNMPAGTYSDIVVATVTF